MGTGESEDLGDSDANAFNEMAFSIEKYRYSEVQSTKGEYSLELAQDLKAIHGLNAEAELLTFFQLRFLLKSTEKLSEQSIRLLKRCCC